MSQLGLKYKQDPQDAEWWESVLEAMRAGVVGMGGTKELAYLADSSPTLVSDALAERDRKRAAAEWLVLVLAHAPEDDAVAIYKALLAIRGYTLGKKKSDLTDGEKLAKVLKTLRTRCGVVGAEIAAEVDE